MVQSSHNQRFKHICISMLYIVVTIQTAVKQPKDAEQAVSTSIQYTKIGSCKCK